ncbi:hypothetical protein ACFWBN_09205 [Streptomyces sp. NPDC059989]|uniref:hypothetical protein n=1 Tax=Streptomyces sp. NPDC059989 TaxID=3347026 RepID=UPI00368E942C
MRQRSPQEKKRLSYLKDRRNVYGENQKSSRRNIPRSRRAQLGINTAPRNQERLRRIRRASRRS